ncbi:MAG: GNAT family N-acetyltransferase, partial [Lachnospiraceae bacterium]|nr:GNAT family N-acetyltransferase [Lachnospiraceae bacterium]
MSTRMDIAKISSRYTVRELNGADADAVLGLCRGNPQFYKYTEARPDIEQIRNEMRRTPPGVDPSAKYYLGFFDSPGLVAVMDLIDGYPEPKTAYIGFFMTDRPCQGKGVGTSIVSETAAFLRNAGKTAVRLAIDKGNPQSSRFWKKNGFEVLYETDVNGWTKLVAERSLREKIIAACGNDCAACPRYTAHPYEKTEDELRHAAELWQMIGYRDRTVSVREISCAGCRPENFCRYHVAACCEDHGVGTCAECPAYPCGN